MAAVEKNMIGTLENQRFIDVGILFAKNANIYFENVMNATIHWIGKLALSMRPYLQFRKM